MENGYNCFLYEKKKLYQDAYPIIRADYKSKCSMLSIKNHYIPSCFNAIMKSPHAYR